MDQAPRVDVFKSDADLGERFKVGFPGVSAAVSVFFPAGIREEADKGFTQVQTLDMFEGDIGQRAFRLIFLLLEEGTEELEVFGRKARFLEDIGAGKHPELADLGKVGVAQAPQGEEFLARGLQRVVVFNLEELEGCRAYIMAVVQHLEYAALLMAGQCPLVFPATEKE